MFPFGCLVWYKKRDFHGSFQPTGVPALYVGPEVLPAMRFKDTHVLYDLQLLTGEGRGKEVITKDIVAPSGKWVFPLTSVPMLKPVTPMPSEPPEFDNPISWSDEVDVSTRNRAITKRRLEQYGQTEYCDGCLLGTYSHTAECRERFNRLLNDSEPLPPRKDVESHEQGQKGSTLEDTSVGMLFVDDVLDHPEGSESVPTCPSDSDEEFTYTPTDPGDLDEIGELVGGSVGKKVGEHRMGLFVEFCCENESACCRVARHLGIPYLGITKNTLNVENPDHFEQLMLWLQEEIQNDCGPVHVWGSIPCTTWSSWQHMALHKLGAEYRDKLEIERAKSLDLVVKYKEVADLAGCSRGGTSTFEWPRGALGWKEEIVQQMVVALNMKPVQVDGCAFGLNINGKRPLKPWTFQTSSERLRQALSSRRCKHPKGHKHDLLEGSLTTKSGVYNVAMATCILTTLFPGVVADRIPAMPIMPFHPEPHRERLSDFHLPSVSVLGTIHKLLSREEMRKDPKALQAIRDEGQGVRQRDVWDDSVVMEKAERLAAARADGKTIHVAEVMPIASIKHWESIPKRKYKGRLVFRGDDVRDTWGGAARFGEMFATPTNIQAINLAIYYGLLEGNTLRAADCCKAYLQAMLLTEEETYVVLPKELWLDSWHGRFKNPTVRLNKALYGHPLASAFWDLHLRQALIGDLGLEAVDGRPSVFMCPKTKLLVVIYVDDVLVSGPERHQDQFWAALKRKVELDEVEQLNQFIGRTHEIDGSQCVFNMLDYCQQAIDLYVEAAGGSGKVQFRKVSTPYVSDSLLTQEDYEVEGQVSAKASSVLMKLLWLTRLARPDLAYAVGSLATQVTRWSKNSDKQLFRLVSYLHSTQGLCLVSKVHDSPQSSTLDLFVDADLGGCPFTSKSTSGLFLVVKGPQGTFAPIAWSSRRQQHVARSTADAELNSLSEGLHEELLPAVMLLEKLLTPELSPKPIVHEDNSAVVQAIEKGYSIKLRHLARTPRLALASLHEAFTSWCQLRQTPTKDQLGDLFTKALAPCKFAPQAIGLEIWKTVPGPSSGQE